MKSVKLVFTLALVACVAAMAAFGAGIDEKKTLGGQVRGIDRAKLESDIPASRPVRNGGATVRYDRSLASPRVATVDAAALSKYPNVSAAGLAGTYSIPGDFPDLAAAAAVVNFVGLDGDAVFELTASNSSGTAGFGGAYPGAGTYNITIRPAASAAVTYAFVATSTNGKGFAFNGASNITIDGLNAGGASLTLEMTGAFPTYDPFGATVYITGGSSGIAILNAHVKGNFNTPAWANQSEGRSNVFIFSDDTDPAGVDGITIDGCTFTGGTVGIKVLPNESVAWLGCENLSVTNCRFGSAFGDPLITAMWLEWGRNVTFSDNLVDGVTFLRTYWYNVPTEWTTETVFIIGTQNWGFLFGLGQATGFHNLLVEQGTYAGNVVRNVGYDQPPGAGDNIISYGCRVYGSGGTVVLYDNRISDIWIDDPTNSTAGIRGPGIDVYHNSVHLRGTAAYDWPSTCLNGANIAKNNAFVNEIDNASPNASRGLTAGGTIDHNAIYGADWPTSMHPTIAAAVAAGVNPNGVFGKTNFTWDLHADSTSPTAAENIGAPLIPDVMDIDGDPRDTAFGGIRDAGADEFPNTGNLLGTDILPAAIVSPPMNFALLNLAVTPTVTVKNNSPNAVSFDMNFAISPDGYSQTVAVSLAPGEAKNVSYPSWTPTVISSQTLTATALYGSDVLPANDTLSRTVMVAQGDPVDIHKIWTFETGAEGWTGSVDWKRSNSFTKLRGSGVCGTGYAWVTERPTDPSTYTEGAYASSQGYPTNYPGANFLTSPWLDLSGMPGTDLYISFSHSIETEAAWDRSWMQYTTDGVNWIDLGVLNDPNGWNWYNEDLYEHAALYGDFIPGANPYSIYGLSPPEASWTSNDNGTTGSPGDGVPTGPSGWVFAQLKVTTASHPDLARAPAVRFRYVAFSDPATAYGGWAFDNFSLAYVMPLFAGGTISGHAWQDVNGNGIDDGEPDWTSTKVYISLFDSVFDSLITDGSGDYNWYGVVFPYLYEVTLGIPGAVYTVPFGITGKAGVCHQADGSTLTRDFGTFPGGVGGRKFSDLNDNGVNDAEPGLAGWTIEVHLDSVGGAVFASGVTDSLGGYSIPLPAYSGDYVAVEVEQPAVGRRTAPAGGSHVFQVTGGTPNVTGKDFGNFVYGRFRVQLNVDQNGNGVKDAGDILAVPSGSTSGFKITKDGVGYTADSVFTLGGGIIAAQFDELDLGAYSVTELDSIPGWRRTLGGVRSFVVDNGGEADTAVYLDFRYLVIAGNTYNDIDGDGVKDGGEPGLAGWTINVSGGAYYGATSAVTDTNGDYSIDSVFNGTHTVSEAAQAGWTPTAPGGGAHIINGISGNLINTTGKDFGNFQDNLVGGLVYRDHNGNGVKDPGDPVMPGILVFLLSGPFGYSDSSGYSFSGVLREDTVGVVYPFPYPGFEVSQPAGGRYPLALTSGASATGLNFGLFQTSDSVLNYRTFTVDQLSQDSEKKPAKAPRAGKPYDPVKNRPSTANLVDYLINPKTGHAIFAVRVGVTGAPNAAGKEKGFVRPNKQRSFWESLNRRGLKHTGTPRGFDQDLKGKPILKWQKSFPPGKKQDNRLFAELLALKLNLVSSGLTTPAGLGALIYSDPASGFDGMTIDGIAHFADSVMTNFEFVPLGVYTALDSIAARINGAFTSGATDDTANGWANMPLTWKAYASVLDVPFLKPNPGVAPRDWRGEPGPERVPMAFALGQNYPNPFNPATTIEFEVPEASLVTLKVYNLLGQEVATLLDREEIEFGDAVDLDAGALPSGVYIYRILAETIADEEAGVVRETFTQSRKMVLIK